MGLVGDGCLLPGYTPAAICPPPPPTRCPLTGDTLLRVVQPADCPKPCQVVGTSQGGGVS